MQINSENTGDFENRLRELVKQTSDSRLVHIMNELAGDGSVRSIAVDESDAGSLTFCLNEPPSEGDVIVHFDVDKRKSYYLLYDIQNVDDNMWEAHIVRNQPSKGLGHYLEPEELGLVKDSNFLGYDI